MSTKDTKDDFSNIPEFDQEEYDKIFIEMAKDRAKIEEDLRPLKYKDFPPGIKKQIKSYIIILIIISIAFLYITYISIKSKIGFYWSSLVFYLLLLFYLILKIRMLFIITEVKNFVSFSGVVINVDKRGMLQNKYFLVKITDGDKILNFRYAGDKKIEKGLPVTLYVNETANIRNTEEGYVVDHLLGIEFSDTNKEVKKKGDVKASDFFN